MEFKIRKQFKVMVGNPMNIDTRLNEFNEKNIVEILKMDVTAGIITMILTVEPREPNWPK